MPYSTCNYTTEIDENECIGDSLTTINANFSALDVAVCDLVNTPQIIINDSPTINLSLTTGKVLSADVRPDSIRYSNLASWQTLSAIPTLSAEAVTQRLPRAWGSFTKTGALTGSSFNVASVIDTSTSQKAVNFITEMPSNLYTVILGIGSETAAMQSFDPFSLFPRTRSGFNIYNTDELQTWTTITFVVYDT